MGRSGGAAGSKRPVCLETAHPRNSRSNAPTKLQRSRSATTNPSRFKNPAELKLDSSGDFASSPSRSNYHHPNFIQGSELSSDDDHGGHWSSIQDSNQFGCNLKSIPEHTQFRPENDLPFGWKVEETVHEEIVFKVSNTSKLYQK